MESPSLNWGVVIGAGGRIKDPALIQAIGTDRKALAQVGGVACVTRVQRAVQAAGFGACVTVGPQEIEAATEHGLWVPEVGRHLDNICAGVEALADVDAFVILPADAPFITGSGIRSFAESVASKVRGETWFGIGLCPSERFQRDFPECPCQDFRLREGRFVSGALYAASRIGVLSARETIQRFSNSRKSQVGLVAKIGLRAMFQYVTGSLDLMGAEQTARRILGGQAAGILDTESAAIVDIDTVEDWQAVLAIAQRLEGA